VHQVGDQPGLYYDAQSTNHQDLLRLSAGEKIIRNTSHILCQYSVTTVANARAETAGRGVGMGGGKNLESVNTLRIEGITLCQIFHLRAHERFILRCGRHNATLRVKAHWVSSTLPTQFSATQDPSMDAGFLDCLIIPQIYITHI